MANFSTNPSLTAFSGYYGGGGRGAATLPGSATSYSATYGGIPNVPNPTATQGQALAGDIGNLGKLYGLAGGINSLNENTLLGNLAKNIPGYTDLISKEAGVTGSELSGNLPQDVITELQQQAAERGIATGSPGSPNANAAYLRALGLDSLQLQQQGFGDLGRMISQTPQAPLFDAQSFLVTPQQQQEAQLQSNIYRSAPVPAAAAQEAEGLASPSTNPLPWWAQNNPAALYGTETAPGQYTKRY